MSEREAEVGQSPKTIYSSKKEQCKKLKNVIEKFIKICLFSGVDSSGNVYPMGNSFITKDFQEIYSNGR
jgi:hypothetical protein